MVAYNKLNLLKTNLKNDTLFGVFAAITVLRKKSEMKSKQCAAYWNDSVFVHESAQGESCGMKSWYLSFHVDEVLEAMEGFRTGDGARPGLDP